MSAVVTETRTVTIPDRVEHAGYHCMIVTLPWVCLKCGGPRGEPFKTLSYDGSMRLEVDGWNNPCGHVEQYALVREMLKAQAELPADMTLTVLQ